MGDMIGKELKGQGKAALMLVSLAIVAVLGMVVLVQFQGITENMATLQANVNTTISATITAFLAGLALFGTFATVTALIIVVKAIIGVVKGMN